MYVQKFSLPHFNFLHFTALTPFWHTVHLLLQVYYFLHFKIIYLGPMNLSVRLADAASVGRLSDATQASVATTSASLSWGAHMLFRSVDWLWGQHYCRGPRAHTYSCIPTLSLCCWWLATKFLLFPQRKIHACAHLSLIHI